MSLRNQITMLYFSVAVIGSAVMIYKLASSLPPVFLLMTSLLPYILLMALFGRFLSSWYEPNDERTKFKKIIGAPVIVFLSSLLLASLIFACSNYLNTLLEQDTYFGMSFYRFTLNEFIIIGLYSGFMFAWFTGLIQFPLLLVGSWYFAKGYRAK